MIEKHDAKKLASTVWHKPQHTFLLGCGTCPDRTICGGLQVRASVLSCMDFCCGEPKGCTIVCPQKSDYSMRVHEVEGFDLKNIKKRQLIHFPSVPRIMPLIYRSLPLAQTIPTDIVAIPFSEFSVRRGKYAFPRTRAELCGKFRLAPSTKIVLSGVENDRRVELWWGALGKSEVLAAMRELGVLFVTTPNFSAIADVPRHDNMHSLKRIALTWAELHDAHIPAAVHVNCRTDFDFIRFGEFLRMHDEIEAISFEYTTGGANEECGEFFTKSLCELAIKVSRPLTLVLRGGVRWISSLAPYYANISSLDTTACMRTIKRQRAHVGSDGRPRWRHSPTRKGAPIDELLKHNMGAMEEHIRLLHSGLNVGVSRTRSAKVPSLKVKSEADDKTTQGSFL